MSRATAATTSGGVRQVGRRDVGPCLGRPPALDRPDATPIIAAPAIGRPDVTGQVADEHGREGRTVLVLGPPLGDLEEPAFG